MRALDSLSAVDYDSAMPVVVYMLPGRFNATPEDSARRSPPKTLYLDDSAVVNMELHQPSEYGEVFSGNIEVAKSRPSFVTLAAESTYADTADGIVVVRATADSVASGADLRLAVIVTEDSMVTQGFLNARWDNVARRVVPSYDGRPITLARGDTLYDTLRFTTIGLNPAQLGAAVYVRDANDLSVLQALSVRRLNH